MSVFKIEPARAEDIPQLVELLDHLFGIELDFTTDAARQARGLELLLGETARSDRAALVVARGDAGKAIAMASAQLVISTAEGAPSAWIEDVVVHPDYRGRGIARAILGHLFDWAAQRGATRAQLVMDADNALARDCYDALGWRGTNLVVRRAFPGR